MKTRSMIRGTPAPCMTAMPTFLAFKLGQYIEERFNTHFSDLALKARHFCVLRVLETAHEPLSQQALCEALWIDRATMTGVMKTLTKLKFISRSDCEVDKRQVLVELTKTGRQFYRANINNFEKLQRDIFASLSQEDLQQFKDVLDRLLLSISSR